MHGHHNALEFILHERLNMGTVARLKSRLHKVCADGYAADLH